MIDIDGHHDDKMVFKGIGAALAAEVLVVVVIFMLAAFALNTQTIIRFL